MIQSSLSLFSSAFSLMFLNTSIASVEKFKYLGSTIATSDSTMTEIKIRLAIARSVTSDMMDVWKSKKLSLELKKRLVKSLVWSVALYGCESWTLRKEEERRIAEFEMWVWRRMLRVSWTDRRTNVWVREKAGVTNEKDLLTIVKERKVAKLCHWKRRPNSLVICVLEGEMPGKTRVGRPKTKWIDNIKAWIDGGVQVTYKDARRRQRPNLLATA